MYFWGEFGQIDFGIYPIANREPREKDERDNRSKKTEDVESTVCIYLYLSVVLFALQHYCTSSWISRSLREIVPGGRVGTPNFFWWGEEVHEVPDIIVISYSVIFSVDAEVTLLYHCSRNWQPPSYVLLLLFSLGSAEMI